MACQKVADGHRSLAFCLDLDNAERAIACRDDQAVAFGFDNRAWRVQKDPPYIRWVRAGSSRTRHVDLRRM